MKDCQASQTCFIGKNPSGKAIPNRQAYAIARSPANRCPEPECFLKNFPDNGRQAVAADKDNKNGKQNIDSGRYGNQLFGCLPDLFPASSDNSRRKNP